MGIGCQGISGEAIMLKPNLLSVVASSLIYFGTPRLANATDYTLTDLATLGGTRSIALGINDSGQVVGWSNTPANGNALATIWNGGTPTALATPSGMFSSAAY